ncbi:MAG: beta-lactamase family protein, partial [Deltaproteobacteria bacterium]|nr:beta-lactamase family protein [Deltaproteobacteria bacterium]
MAQQSTAIRPAIFRCDSNRAALCRSSFALTYSFIVSTLVAAAVSLVVTQSFASEVDSFYVGRLGHIDELVQTAIRDRRLPGAVVLVGGHNRIYYRKAFGKRALVPSMEPMTVDTIFDLSSLTKVVATTPSIMLLVEQGRIRLDSPVADYIPGF